MAVEYRHDRTLFECRSLTFQAALPEGTLSCSVAISESVNAEHWPAKLAGIAANMIRRPHHAKAPVVVPVVGVVVVAIGAAQGVFGSTPFLSIAFWLAAAGRLFFYQPAQYPAKLI